LLFITLYLNEKLSLLVISLYSLGIDHDEDDTCTRDNVAGGNIMVKKLYATSSNYQWSRCSSKMIWQNLK